MISEKKLVSIVVPIYNEESMVEEIYSRVSAVFDTLDKFNYELVFFDDGSTDGTTNAIEKLCKNHPEVKAVFYSRNFGYLKNTFYCLQQAKGDCAIILHADLQNPPEIIPQFLEKWEKGAQVVLGVKNKSKENKFVYFLRTIFYFLFIKLFQIKIIPHATEFELMDKSFIKVLDSIEDSYPFLRGIIMEYADSIDTVTYTQDARKRGKSKFNLKKYYEFAMCGITRYSRTISRIAILFSLISIPALIAEFLFIFLPKQNFSDVLSLTNNILLRAIPFLIIALIFLISLLFEYVFTIQQNSIEKPFIIEKKRIDY